MKKSAFLTNIILILFVLSQSALSQTREVTVQGTVTDSNGQPIADAIILVTADADVINNPFDSLISIDTIFSGADGTFSKQITVELNAFLLYCIVAKSGYSMQIKIGTIQLTGVADLGTIVLPVETLVPVTITGRVLDSATAEPIPEALVIITNSSVILDTIYDSVFTDAQGTFSLETEMGSSGMIIIVYMAMKDGYETKGGYSEATQGTTDLGDILLVKSTPIIYTPVIKKQIAIPNRVEIYSAAGRLLYSGPQTDVNRLRHLDVMKSQPVILRFKRDTKVLYNKYFIAVE